MTKLLDAGRVRDYRAQGCVFPVRLFSAEEARGHRARLEQAEAAHGPMHYVVKPYLVLRSAYEIATHPRLLDAVEDILGPDVLLWDGAYVIKEPRDRRFVSWHQDLTYWGLDSDDVVTAWVALSPSTRASGCMRFVPGTHRAGRRAHLDTHAEDNILHRGQTIAGVDDSSARDIELAPGEASLHHGWVVHGSNPNPSPERRIGLVLQYLDPRVRQRHTDTESATLVRGTDRHGHFAAEPRCETDFAPAAVAFRREVERLKHQVYDTDG